MAMRLMKEKEKDRSPVSVLAEDYQRDLDALRNLSPLIITPQDIDQLKILSLKYGLEPDITKKNFIVRLGMVNSCILDKLEALAIENVLDSERQKDPSKKPRRESFETQEVPESLRDD